MPTSTWRAGPALPSGFCRVNVALTPRNRMPTWWLSVPSSPVTWLTEVTTAR